MCTELARIADIKKGSVGKASRYYACTFLAMEAGYIITVLAGDLCMRNRSSCTTTKAQSFLVSIAH